MTRLESSAEKRKAVYQHFAVQSHNKYLSTNVLRSTEDAIQVAKQALLWHDGDSKDEVASDLDNLGVQYLYKAGLSDSAS